MNTKTILTTLLLASGLLNTTAQAEWHTKLKNRTLYIMSGEVGEEDIDVRNFWGTLLVFHDQTGDMEFFDISMIDRIEFYGDDDDDRFENLTSIPVMAFGGDGDDVLIGGSGGDSLYGEDGYDSVIGNGGNDFLHAGTDLFEAKVDGGLGDDIGVIWRVPTKAGRVNQVFVEGFDLGGQKHDETRHMPFSYTRPPYHHHY